MSKCKKDKMSENFKPQTENEESLDGAGQEKESTVCKETQENCEDVPSDIEEETTESMLIRVQAENAELKDRLLRQIAEFDNYRKRTMKEKADIILNGSAGVVTDILPVIDDLERAVSNSAQSEDFAALKEGIELIYHKLMHILEQKGLAKISPKNEPFDTDFHEAIAMIPAPDEASKGLVLDCAIDGYKLNDKVLRHAKVAVGQ